MSSWRTTSVALLSFSSGLPLGIVWYSIPDWMRSIGVDIRIVGFFALAQAPWAFKVLWSPLMDRFVPPVWGRRRGWMAITQFSLSVLTLMLAGVGHNPQAIWVVGALALSIALASASQDIAIDAYAVEVLRDEEQGAAVGARVALYRASMFVAGGLAITEAAKWGWPTVNALLALAYLPFLLITWKAPEPEQKQISPPTLREAIWQPFLGFLSRHRALEILAFVFFYKFADQLAQALTRPFLIDMGYNAVERGRELAIVAAIATILGTFIGGWFTTLIGLGHALWVFGLLQVFSNIGYFIVAGSDAERYLMFGAASFELLTSGMGTGAFSVLLLRMTQKRFSATQYALFSSLFSLPRLLAGPISGFVVDAIGWRWFFLTTLPMGIPGLILLSRFVPIGTREPVFTVQDVHEREASSGNGGLRQGVLAGVLAVAFAYFVVALLGAIKAMRETPMAAFDFAGAMMWLFRPLGIADWVQIIGILVFGLLSGLVGAAVSRSNYSNVRNSNRNK